ncbi:MAG: phosphate ABC transporter ATP-binding protein [Bacteroidales bacterium]|nr:phosphate ABC transporter ATP-binding protein [Bacteroidales bacterium]
MKKVFKMFRPDHKFARGDGNSYIKIENLNVSIANNHILKNVNIDIPDNKITCIIGPSGCGKTTLLKTLNLLIYAIDGVDISGKIDVNGTNIIGRDFDIEVHRRMMGLVWQKPVPLPMSIFENVAYGCRVNGTFHPRKLKMIVEHYLTAVGLWDEVKDRLRAPATSLSVGQQQRLCLARSLAVEPSFILADEATSALDPMSSKTIEELFVRLKENYSIVMVTHTLSQAQRIADNVIFMYMGQVIEAGSAEQIFKNPQHELTQNYISGAFS